MTSSALLPLTVVMPAYNEAQGIRAAVTEIQASVLDRIAGADLIVVNDGSTDSTGAILDGFANDPRIRVVHQTNAGHGRALRTGLDAASGEFLLLVDSDQQVPLENVVTHWRAVQAGDGLYGVRRHRHDPALRIGLTRVVRAVIWLIFGVSLADANVPYKFVRRSLWRAAAHVIPNDTLAPSLFLAIFSARRGFHITYADVMHRERTSGDGSLRKWKLFGFALRGFRQLIAFRRAIGAER